MTQPPQPPERVPALCLAGHVYLPATDGYCTNCRPPALEQTPQGMVAIGPGVWTVPESTSIFAGKAEAAPAPDVSMVVETLRDIQDFMQPAEGAPAPAQPGVDGPMHWPNLMGEAQVKPPTLDDLLDSCASDLALARDEIDRLNAEIAATPAPAPTQVEPLAERCFRCNGTGLYETEENASQRDELAQARVDINGLVVQVKYYKDQRDAVRGEADHWRKLKEQQQAEAEQLRRERDEARRIITTGVVLYEIACDGCGHKQHTEIAVPQLRGVMTGSSYTTFEDLQQQLEAARAALAEREPVAFVAGWDARRREEADGLNSTNPLLDALRGWQATQPATPSEREPDAGSALRDLVRAVLVAAKNHWLEHGTPVRPEDVNAVMLDLEPELAEVRRRLELL